MAKKSNLFSSRDVKTVILTAIGVFVGGLIMYFGRDIDVVKNATKGFDA